MKKQAVISLSGGLDSSTLLLRLLRDGYEVQALSFDYGQKHKIELERANELVEYINGYYDHLMDSVPMIQLGPNFYPVKHQIIKIDGLSQLLNSSLVEGGSEVPEGHYEDSNMSKTVVENRNKIFSSIIQSVALAKANKHNTECVIAMGIHAGDHQIYKDCRSEFRDADYQAFLEGNENAEKVTYYTPYLEVNKFDILKDGEQSCKELGLNFNEVYSKTNTSYKPIKMLYYDPETFELKGDIWFSDYKSASSVERVEAFIKLGRPDPVSYADETGPVSWEHVVAEVTKVLESHNNE